MSADDFDEERNGVNFMGWCVLGLRSLWELPALVVLLPFYGHTGFT